jgi:hypothetical protein
VSFLTMSVGHVTTIKLKGKPSGRAAIRVRSVRVGSLGLLAGACRGFVPPALASKKGLPWRASDTSPGSGTWPPPISPTSEGA